MKMLAATAMMLVLGSSVAMAGSMSAHVKPSPAVHAMKGHAMKSDAMKGHAMKSDAMKGHAMKSDAMKGHAMKSDRMMGKPQPKATHRP